MMQMAVRIEYEEMLKGKEEEHGQEKHQEAWVVVLQ
jgi:hypothetical protein